MSELGPDAKRLVEAGRRAFKPTTADRERVLAALLPHVGTSLAPIGTPSAQGFTQGALFKASLAVVGAGLVGGGLMLAWPEQPPVARATPHFSMTSMSPSEAPSPPLPSLAPPSDPVQREQAPVAHAQRAEDRLAEEVEILSRAGAALRGGRPALALKAVEEHRRRFPTGVLSQERSAARVQALCALGRTDEGLRELKRLERTAPSSPHVARARKACNVESPNP